MNRSISIAALVAAALALMVALHALKDASANASAQSKAQAEESQNLAASLAALDRKISKIEEAHRRLALSPGGPATAHAPRDPRPIDQLLERVEKLEGTQAQLEKKTRDIDKFGVLEGMEKGLIKAYNTLLDTNQPIAARVKQAEKLKGSGHFDEPARLAMVELYQNARSPNDKMMALAALGGVATPEIRDQVLQDLTQEIQDGNKSPRFRYHAVEALEPLLPDPAVQQWLAHLAQTDPEPKIAARAGQPVGITPAPAKASR